MDISGPFTMVIFNYFLLKFVYYNWFQTISITVFLVYKFQTPGSSPCFSTGTDEERNEELALIMQAKEPRLLWEHGKKQNFVLDYLKTIVWKLPAYFSCLNLAFQIKVKWSVSLWFRTSQNLAGKEIQRKEEKERGKWGMKEDGRNLRRLNKVIEHTPDPPGTKEQGWWETTAVVLPKPWNTTLYTWTPPHSKEWLIPLTGISVQQRNFFSDDDY